VQVLEALLAGAKGPLTVGQLVEAVGDEADEELIRRTLWDNPENFLWQPGHRWWLAGRKLVTPAMRADVVVEDSHERLAVPPTRVEMRAVTLSSGLTVKVSKASLDSTAPFTVKTAGTTVELVLNASHGMFRHNPLPFQGEDSSGAFELLLTAWALHESAAPSDRARDELADIRFMLGRRAQEVLREG
jgi:hypothetical protein